MASVVRRGNKYSVVYNYKDDQGVRKQKWESYKTRAEAEKRKREIDYKKDEGTFFVTPCKDLSELLSEYVSIYGYEKWALSTYEANVGIINNYILPIIGNVKLKNITSRFLTKYYQKLLKTPAVPNPAFGNKSKNEYVAPGTIRDIHKLLNSCFRQAVKWELMEKNPAENATVPKYKPKKREIWEAEDLLKAMECCKDENLKMALHLSFCGSLRMGELLALTWDCVDISEEAIRKEQACFKVEKELQRVSVSTLETLDSKDVLFVFPPQNKKCKTVQVLKTPKTESSIRIVFLPTTVALMLVEWKKKQDETREYLGSEYQDYNLVLPTNIGTPQGANQLRKALKKLIKENDLPQVVFHSLRHTSVTYKLKLNKGDIKAVQGDSGHSQPNMVLQVYSHIIDNDRRKNASLFEQEFYQNKNTDPKMMEEENEVSKAAVTPAFDQEKMKKLMENPEAMALFQALMDKLQ